MACQTRRNTLLSTFARQSDCRRYAAVRIDRDDFTQLNRVGNDGVKKNRHASSISSALDR